MEFQRYNIKEKQKEKGRKKKIIKKQTNKQKKEKKKHTNNHPKSIYGVCLKKKIVIIGYRNKN